MLTYFGLYLVLIWFLIDVDEGLTLLQPYQCKTNIKTFNWF